MTKDLTTPLSYALRWNIDDCEETWNAFLEAGADLMCRDKMDSVGFLSHVLHWVDLTTA
jgi:hypothetical protein